MNHLAGLSFAHVIIARKQLPVGTAVGSDLSPVVHEVASPFRQAGRIKRFNFIVRIKIPVFLWSHEGKVRLVESSRNEEGTILVVFQRLNHPVRGLEIVVLGIGAIVDFIGGTPSLFLALDIIEVDIAGPIELPGFFAPAIAFAIPLAVIDLAEAERAIAVVFEVPWQSGMRGGPFRDLPGVSDFVDPGRIGPQSAQHGGTRWAADRPLVVVSREHRRTLCQLVQVGSLRRSAIATHHRTKIVDADQQHIFVIRR